MTTLPDPLNPRAMVLEYAPPFSPWAGMRRNILRTIVPICALIGAAIGEAMQPVTYTSTAYFTRPGNLEIDALLLRQRGTISALPHAQRNTPVIVFFDDVASRLRVRVIPDSRMLEISFTDPDPSTAQGVVSMILDDYRRDWSGTVILPPRSPVIPDHHLAFPIGGAVGGAILGVIARRELRRYFTQFV